MASIALGAAGAAAAGPAGLGLVTATGSLTFGGSLLAGGFAIGGSIIDSLLINPLLAGSIDGTPYVTDYGSVRASQGDELTPVPRCLGEYNRVACLPIWSSPPRARRDVQNRRGKRGESATTIAVSWLQSAAHAFAGNDCVGMRRILVDGQPVYDERPDLVVTASLNDNSQNRGASMNYTRYFIRDVSNPGGGTLPSFPSELWHLVLESTPGVDEIGIAAVDRTGESNPPFGFARNLTRITLATGHGLPVGTRVPVRVLGVDSYDASDPATRYRLPLEEYFYWALVPDIPASAVTFDLPIDETRLYNNTQLPEPTGISVVYEPQAGSVVQIDRRAGLPLPSSLGLESFDVGSPVVLKNVTKDITFDDPGFECVVSREVGNGIRQLILDVNTGFTGPTGQFDVLRYWLDHVETRAETAGSYSVSTSLFPPEQGGIPFPVDTGDQLEFTQVREPDEDFADQWEFVGIDAGSIETQGASAVVQGELAGDELPFWRGLNFFATENINTSGAGSRIGNFEAYPVEEAQKPLSTALQDLCSEWGVSGQFNTGTLILEGMSWAGRIEATRLLDQLAIAYDLVGKEEEYGEVRFDRRLQTTTWDFDSREVNPDGENVFILDDEGNRITYVGEDISTRPTEITVGFFDLEDDLNRGAVTERLSTVGRGADEQSISLSISMTSDKARDIGRRLIRQFHNWTAIEFRLPGHFNFIRENDQIIVTVREAVETLGVQSTYGRRLRILVSKCDDGIDGILRCEGRIASYDEPLVGNSEEQVELANEIEEADVFGEGFRDTKRNTAGVTDNARPSWNVEIFSGPAFFSADEGKTGYYVAAAPLDDQAQLLGATAYRSVDSGATWETLGEVPMATMGYLDGNPLLAAADIPTADPEALKPYIEIYGGQALSTTTATGLTLGRNRALVGTGDTTEVIQFTSATAVERGRFQLETVTRGLLGTDVVAHPAPERFVLLDDSIPFFEVRQEEMGLTHEIRVVPVGKTLDDVRSHTIDIPAFVAPLTPKDHHYTFVSQDISGSAFNTIGFKEHGEIMSSLSAEIVAPYDMTIEKLTYDIRALAGGADMTISVKDGASTLWTSPALGAMVFDFSSNRAVLDVAGLSISAGSKFQIELNSPTTAIASWTIRAGLVASWNS